MDTAYDLRKQVNKLILFQSLQYRVGVEFTAEAQARLLATKS